MAERLALPTSDHGVAGSNPAGGEIIPESKRRFIAQSLSCLPFHRLEMTEILLKGRKTLTHPSTMVFSILVDETYFVYRSIIPNYKKNNGIKGSTTLMEVTGERSTVLSFLGFSRNVSGQKLLVYHILILIHRGAKLYSQRRANLKILNSAPELYWHKVKHILKLWYKISHTLNRASVFYFFSEQIKGVY